MVALTRAMACKYGLKKKQTLYELLIYNAAPLLAKERDEKVEKKLLEKQPELLQLHAVMKSKAKAMDDLCVEVQRKEVGQQALGCNASYGLEHG